MQFKAASSATDTLPLDEKGISWLRVRTDLSKRSFNDLISLMPAGIDEEGGITPAAGAAFQTGLVKALVTDWHLDGYVDAKGRSVNFSLGAYLDLTPESAAVIDIALAKYFEKMNPKPEEAEDEDTKSA